MGLHVYFFIMVCYVCRHQCFRTLRSNCTGHEEPCALAVALFPPRCHSRGQRRGSMSHLGFQGELCCSDGCRRACRSVPPVTGMAMPGAVPVGYRSIPGYRTSRKAICQHSFEQLLPSLGVSGCECRTEPVNVLFVRRLNVTVLNWRNGCDGQSRCGNDTTDYQTPNVPPMCHREDFHCIGLERKHHII